MRHPTPPAYSRHLHSGHDSATKHCLHAYIFEDLRPSTWDFEFGLALLELHNGLKQLQTGRKVDTGIRLVPASHRQSTCISRKSTVFKPPVIQSPSHPSTNPIEVTASLSEAFSSHHDPRLATALVVKTPTVAPGFTAGVPGRILSIGFVYLVAFLLENWSNLVFKKYPRHPHHLSAEVIRLDCRA